MRYKARPRKVFGGLGARVRNPYLKRVLVAPSRKNLFISPGTGKKAYPAGHLKRKRKMAVSLYSRPAKRARGVHMGTIARLPTTLPPPRYKRLQNDPVVLKSHPGFMQTTILNAIPCITLAEAVASDMVTDAQEAAALNARMDNPLKRTSNRVLLKNINMKFRITARNAPSDCYLEMAVLCSKSLSDVNGQITSTSEVLKGIESQNQSTGVSTTYSGWVQSMQVFNTDRYSVLARKRIMFKGPGLTSTYNMSDAQTGYEAVYGYNTRTVAWSLPINKVLQYENDASTIPTNMPIYFVWWWDSYTRLQGQGGASSDCPTVQWRYNTYWKDLPRVAY